MRSKASKHTWSAVKEFLISALQGKQQVLLLVAIVASMVGLLFDIVV